MKSYLYGVVIRRAGQVKRTTVTAENLEKAFGKAAVLAAGEHWPENVQEFTLWVRRIHDPHEKEDFSAQDRT